MATILQLGAGVLMKHSIRQIQALGHQVYAIDRNPQAPAFPLADGHAALDLVDTDGIVRYARQIGADAILAANEAGVLAAAEASAQLGLRGLPPEVAMRALDKGAMRTAWERAHLSQPRFRIVASQDAIAAAAQEIGYPLVLKPTRNWGSRGTSLVESADGLAWAIDFAAEHQRSGRFIVEQRVDGLELNVDGLVQGGRLHILSRSDKSLHPHPRYRVEMQHNYPARLREEQRRIVDALVADAVRALGLDDCAIHAEVMLDGETAYLIEMAGRPGGGHIFGQIVGAVSGVSMPQALCRILLGETVDLTPTLQRGAVYRFFGPQEAGIFRSVEGLEEAQALPGVLDFGFHMEPGTVVHPVRSGAERPGYCVVVAETREQAEALAQEAVAHVRYILDPLE